MPNKKLSELDQITEIATGDIMLISDISENEGSRSKYISFQQLDDRYAVFNPTATPVGEMYETDNAINTTITTLNEWVKVSNFTAGRLNLVTFSSDSLIIASSGDYLLVCNMDAIGVAVQSRKFEFTVRINGTPVVKTKRSRGLSNAASGAFGLSGILTLIADDVVDVVVRNTETTDNVLILNANISIDGI